MIRVCVVCLIVAGFALQAEEAKPAKVTVTIRGAVTDKDAEALTGTLKKIEGVRFKAEEIQAGEPRHYFTPPFVIEIADLNKTDLGVIAKAVAETKTPKRSEVPPSLNLVLYHPNQQFEETDVVALREALADVSGVDARGPGGTGGDRFEGRFWVRLDGSGNAKLTDIQDALKKGNLDLKLQKP